jgi:hypothetical protein
MRLCLLPLACAALLACPAPVEVMDSGLPIDSGSMDAGQDAGHPPHDAGFDAGWQSVPETLWCHSLATARCWRSLRCGSIDDTLLSDCIARGEFGCDSVAYVRSGAEGRHSYDPVRAARCLDAFDWGNCQANPPQCAQVFIGRTLPTSPSGALVPEDCDLDAGFYDPYATSCPHRCLAYAALGEPCFDNQGRYAPSCKPGVHGCEYDDAGMNEVCQPPRMETEACRGPYACALGLACSVGKCVRQTAATGEPCDVENGYPFCGADDFCKQGPPVGGMTPPGVCQRRVGLGGVCVGYGSCLPSLRCSSTIGTGVCQRRAGVAEPCSGNYTDECADGLWCPNNTSRCALLPGDGGDCSFMGTNYECAVGYSCSQFPDYLCMPRLADGQPCNGYDDLCLSNECQYGTLPDAGFGYRCVRCSQMADGGS